MDLISLEKEEQMKNYDNFSNWTIFVLENYRAFSKVHLN